MVDDDSGQREDESRREEVDARSSAESEFPLDVIFDILSNKRRRLVIEYLRKRDGSVDLTELAEHIAAVENDKPVAELSSSERKRVYVGLYQTHLPKMSDAGIVEFEQDMKRISLLPGAVQLFPYLDIDGGQAEPEQRSAIERSADVRDMAEQLHTLADRLADLS